jgi:hypothetical protein
VARLDLQADKRHLSGSRHAYKKEFHGRGTMSKIDLLTPHAGIVARQHFKKFFALLNVENVF